MPDKEHAADAKGRATQQVKKGNLSIVFAIAAQLVPVPIFIFANRLRS
jgi:hypothetical protein